MAHENSTGIVKERMDLMKNLGKAMKAFSLTLRAQNNYNIESLRSIIIEIKDHSGENLTKQFLEKSIDMTSAANPIIWESWSSFSGIARDLFNQSERLERRLTSSERPNINELVKSFRLIARTCKNCHSQFKIP
ncbi:MAG: cytochrome c [Rhodospirillales bacterium]|tara:strand:+ start:6227 stop:6628 length:402 start_codon:yes stop_codon:yes gene_type:complete